MKKIIRISERNLTAIVKSIIEEQISKRIDPLVDNLLDKINKYGIQSLSYDEKTFLDQYSADNVDMGLKNWIESNDQLTFDVDGNKLPYYEFDEDEDIFINTDKLIKIISRFMNKKPFSNNADWGGARVWNIKSDNDYVGTFFYLGDDELLILKRIDIDGKYEDEIVEEIRNPKELYKVFAKIIKMEL